MTRVQNMQTADEQPLTPQEQAEFDRLEKAFTPAHYAALEAA